MSKQQLKCIALAAFAFALVGCMPGPNPLKGTPVDGGHVAGFGLGLWHGLIAPVSFITSLLKDGTGFYEVHNSGGWYNAGFLIGMAIVLGGGSFQGNLQLRRGNPGATTGANPGPEIAPNPGPQDTAAKDEDRKQDGPTPKTKPAN